MSKVVQKETNPVVVNGIKIYSIDYLSNAELSETDLSNIFEKNSKNLLYSIIIGMFKKAGSKMEIQDIVKLVKDDDMWMEKTTWTRRQYESFESELTKALMNLYQYNKNEAKFCMESIMTKYGLSIRQKHK